MKKTGIIAAILALLLTVGGGTAYAAGQVARSNAIGEETACNFAYVDAGILPEEAQVTRTEFDFEKGRFVYEIEFTAAGMLYEYTVDSANGRILERKSEVLPGQPQPVAAPAEPAPVDPVPTASAQSGVPETIGSERAKQLALEAAGLEAADVVFDKIRLEWEDGRWIYDVEFYVPNTAEHDFEIDAISGRVLVQSSERRDAPGAAAPASAPGGTAPRVPADSISLEQAKQLALSQAGLSERDVVLGKARLEQDDGHWVYDIEFYGADATKYEYEISAVSGKLLEQELDHDDRDDDRDDDWDDDRDDDWDDDWDDD